MTKHPIDVLSLAINIIESACDTHEKEVNDTLKDLLEMKSRLKYNISRRKMGYGNKSKTYKNN